ncbi:MAG: hypothetical protein K1X74_02600 [Pirellulales bacterium]|nr:hypothetical protein [Pirellulales bacterium]
MSRTYDLSRSYEWNYDNAPGRAAVPASTWPDRVFFCGQQIGSPLGVAAGPLLNGRWLAYYAGLGFDVLTYKTVRSVARACYPWPNLQPVSCGSLYGGEADLPAVSTMHGSWAVSFGMPSQPPEIWRADVEWARAQMHSGQLLVVSVVGTVQDGWTIDDLAADYARCAAWAIESGAHAIEANFSCPNVATCDGQLYQQPRDARIVAQALRAAIGDRPLVLKLGHVNEADQADELLAAVGDVADALAMTNSVAATVVASDGQRMFSGERRGICGAATREASLRQTRLFRELIDRRGLKLELVGVGGIAAAEHVRQYLDAGATVVELATAAMVDPGIALTIRAALAGHAP